MIEKLLDLLKFAYRQKVSFYAIPEVIGKIFSDFSLGRLFSSLLVIVTLIGSIVSDTAVIPHGDPLNLDGYELVFSDDFEGDELNLDVWQHRGVGSRRSGYNAESQVQVKDGNLIFTGEYLENGEFGPGWYVGMIKLRQQYKQGYFEIRCKCNKGDDFWSAFWIQAEHPYDHELSKGGIGGAELDIFENLSSEAQLGKRGSVTQTIHCNGGDDDVENIDSCSIGKFFGRNIYDEYNTYGLKWTEDEYIFYINGIETGRSTWSKGVSQEFEDVIVSLEIPDEVNQDKNFKTYFTVDYVKIWQEIPEGTDYEHVLV